MRPQLVRYVIVAGLGLGTILVGWPRPGAAEDVDHNAEIKRRLAQWKATPHADLLFKGVQFAPANGPENNGGSKSFALCIGVNVVDANHYGSENRLSGAVPDAQAMAAITTAAGFKTTRMLLDRDATTDNLFAVLREQAGRMAAGDTFLLSYSGHGSQTDDIGPTPDEADDLADETLCLFNRQLIDDELFEELRAFKPGVRILLFTDSCHSGTVARAVFKAAQVLDDRSRPEQANRLREIARVLPPVAGAAQQALARERVQLRQIDPATGKRLFRDSPSYNAVKSRNLKGDEGASGNLGATLLHFAACEDRQEALEINGQGVFTGAVIATHGAGTATNYAEFFAEISRRVTRQTPKFTRYGPALSTFEGQKPFTP